MSFPWLHSMQLLFVFLWKNLSSSPADCMDQCPTTRSSISQVYQQPCYLLSMSTDSAYFLEHQLPHLPSADVNWFSLPFLEHWLFQLPFAHVNWFGICFGHQQFWVIYCVCINSSSQYSTYIILSVYLLCVQYWFCVIY